VTSALGYGGTLFRTSHSEAQAAASFHSVFHRLQPQQSEALPAAKWLRMNDKGENFRFTHELASAPSNHADQIARGPRSSRTGNIKSALSRLKTPWTVIPTIRNGKVSNHTIGYKTSASNANGQHRIKRMHHKRKAAMATSILADVRQLMQHGHDLSASLLKVTMPQAEKFPRPQNHSTAGALRWTRGFQPASACGNRPVLYAIPSRGHESLRECALPPTANE